MQKKLVSLQVARGLAAMMVFVMHLFNMAAATTASAWAAKIAHALHYVGHIGVDIFFVLSGVVMCLVLPRAVAYEQTGRGRIAVAADFLARRAVRIYPLYWITLIACLVLPPIPGADNALGTLLHHPASFFLFSKPAAHPVAWTLVYEVQFYCVAALLLLFGRFARKVFLIWSVLQIFLVVWSCIGVLPRWPIFDPLSLEFSLGIFMGLVSKVNFYRMECVGMAIAIGAACSASLWWGGDAIAAHSYLRVIFWGLPAAVFIASLMAYERTHALQYSFMARLGDLSYSLYMWHPIGLLVPLVLLQPWNKGGSIKITLIYCMLSIALTFILSIISYRYIEKPLNGLFKLVRDRKKLASHL